MKELTELDKKVIHDISPYVSWCTAELRISNSVKPKNLIFWYDYIILNPNNLITIKLAFFFCETVIVFFLFWPTSAKLRAMTSENSPIAFWSLASITVDLENCSEFWFFTSSFGYYFWRREILTTKDFRYIILERNERVVRRLGSGYFRP